jgi:transposase
MPWEQTTTMGSWTEEAMKEAVNAVLTQTLSLRKAVERYGVPRSTLCDRVQEIKKNGNGYMHTFLFVSVISHA